MTILFMVRKVSQVVDAGVEKPRHWVGKKSRRPPKNGSIGNPSVAISPRTSARNQERSSRMSETSPISQTAASHASRLNGKAKSTSVSALPVESNGVARSADELELSNRAVLLSRLRELPAIRADLVQRVKSEIATGVYESPEKIDIAVEALGREIAEEI